MKSKSIDNIIKYIKYYTLLKKKRKPLSTLVIYFFSRALLADAHLGNERALVTICDQV